MLLFSPFYAFHTTNIFIYLPSKLLYKGDNIDIKEFIFLVHLYFVWEGIIGRNINVDGLSERRRGGPPFRVFGLFGIFLSQILFLYG